MADKPLPLRLAELIRRREEVAFLFDFDGTLVDLVPHPDDVRVPAQLIGDVKKIAARPDAAFAIVTGRALHKLDEFMENVTTAAIGSHGAEWRPSAAGKSAPLADPLPLILRKALTAIGEKHDCIVEDKGYTISLHLPFDQAEKDLLPELIAAAGGQADHYVFRKVGRTYEILQKTVNKGAGIRRLMELPSFAGRMPVYIGDDVHDDHSLGILREIGGVLLPVGHAQNSGHAVSGDDFLRIEDVLRTVTALATFQG